LRVQFSRAYLALLAALLFGASTPAAKWLTGSIDPFVLAGLLYLGSGIGLAVWLMARRLKGADAISFVPKSHSEKLYLGGAILFGGVIAPVLLMFGLAQTSSSTASLLLNLEGAFTAALACLVFHEHYGKRLVLGMTLILFGGGLLSTSGNFSTAGTLVGALCIAGACVGWAIDNNLTRQVGSLDAPVLAMMKGLIAGTVNLGIAFSLRKAFPESSKVLLPMFVGFLGYGLSLVFFILSLRKIGTARTSAYFSTAPFVGAVLSLALFHESVSFSFAIAGIAMGIGVWLHLTEQHEHFHVHEPMEHEHIHVHDEHHQHAHSSSDPPGQPHSHRHRHEHLEHSHSHIHDDLHHSHEH
jgi:drug/metabolite transporter (DMT)-like permease